MAAPHAHPLRSRLRGVVGSILATGLTVAATRPAWGWVDIFDRGPALIAGKFNLRVTNAGIVGNPFPSLSYDPSFEYPKGSGRELMQYASLWVGALDVDGQPRVSGGPLLEFRPTTASDDTVRQLWHGRLGAARGVDDDGDGVFDEETFNGRDDDGDGEVDEDLGVIGQQMLVADYTDDQPEAIAAQQANGERHHPLGLTVHQETYAWSYPGYEGIAGLQYRITNHTGATLRDVYLGLYVDLDEKVRDDPAGHQNDAVQRVTYTRSIPKGSTTVYVEGQGSGTFACFDRYSRAVAMVSDDVLRDMPVVAVLPLAHPIDPLARVLARGGISAPQGELASILRRLVRTPGGDTFRTFVFASDRAAGAGRPPILDSERYAAMKGEWPESPDTHIGDQQILVSCGPFPRLGPGDSFDLTFALVAASQPESLQVALGNAAFLYNGVELNLLPDATGPRANWWLTGETGVNGHEACVSVPEGVEFQLDPHCPTKFAFLLDDVAPPAPVTYRAGPCIWTDADCSLCTGMSGRETVVRWVDLKNVPAPPSYRITPGDRTVRIEWDNLPEILINAGRTGPPGGKFIAYRVYRLSDWRERSSVMPTRERWASLGTYGYDDTESKVLLSTVTDSTLDYVRLWYEQRHYPVGYYAVTDSQPFNGFDYVYAVTTVVETRQQVSGGIRVERFESPLVATFDERVAPRVEARSDTRGVWVVPNPFRVSADWDRPPIYGDRLTRHLDFMGLPRARCTIRIWTVAGDHVATVEHDGTRGSGQASWNLVSRNGQEVSSGVYLYTVESPAGSATGRFVVIR